MAYKDKDKQREANKEQMRRARAKGNTKQAISQGNTDNSCVTFTGLTAQAGHVRVSKPGDDDYEITAHPEQPKRGKDIKCFADLPPDVQRSIDSRNVSPEVRSKLTANAIDYQHKYPGSYERG